MRQEHRSLEAAAAAQGQAKITSALGVRSPGRFRGWLAARMLLAARQPLIIVLFRVKVRTSRARSIITPAPAEVPEAEFGLSGDM